MAAEVAGETAHHGPMEQFEIHRIFSLNLFGHDISFTNSALMMTIAVVLTTVLLVGATARAALVPGRMQSVAELLYEFVAGMVRENVGDEGRKYFPLVFTIFMFILFGNLLGLIPYSFNFTGLTVHEWVGVVLAVALPVHVTLHWDWVARTTRRLVMRRRGGREALRWLVDLLLMPAMTLCVASGFLISRHVLPAIGVATNTIANARSTHPRC